MDESGSHPCLNLGDGPEHWLLAWAGRKMGRRGLVMMNERQLAFRLEHEGGGMGIDTFQPLEDAGYVEKARIGESYRYRVLVFCDCAGGLYQTPAAVRRREPIMRSAQMGEQFANSLCADSVGVKSESAQKSVVTLANHFFPEVVRGAGIQMTPLQTNGPALVRHLRSWKAQGVDIDTMELMIEEFARHPEWCRQSRKTPWQVFVGRRGELASLITFRKRKDPANRRWSAGKDWFGHTPRSYSPA